MMEQLGQQCNMNKQDMFRRSWNSTAALAFVQCSKISATEELDWNFNKQ